MKKRFYVIYDIEDNYILECTSYKELEEFFNRNRNSLESSISKFKNEENRNAIKSKKDGKLYKVYIYKDDDNESDIQKRTHKNI
jgi:hypothetical protein